MVKAGKSGVAVEIARDLGQIQYLGAWQCGAVERFAANHEHRLGSADTRERRIERGRELEIPLDRTAAAGDDEVLSPGERLADRLPGAPPHDDRVPGRQCAKAAHVLRQAPRQAVLDADNAV